LDHESGVVQAFDSILRNATSNFNSTYNSNNSNNCSVIDVGTNAGFYSLMSAAHGCNVFGFEIQANCIDWLARAALADNVQDKIHVFHNPVSSQVKHLRIKYSEEHSCDGNFGFTREDCPACDHHKFATERTFNTTTLDSAFSFLLDSSAGAGAAGGRSGVLGSSIGLHVTSSQLQQITFIDLLKVDVEGHDVEVLRGARYVFCALDSGFWSMYFVFCFLLSGEMWQSVVQGCRGAARRNQWPDHPPIYYHIFARGGSACAHMCAYVRLCVYIHVLVESGASLPQL